MGLNGRRLRACACASAGALVAVLALAGSASADDFPFTRVVSQASDLSVATSGDLNGDGNRDLVLVGSGATWEAFGNGDGTFEPAQQILDSDNVVVADFSGDGVLDIATARLVTASVMSIRVLTNEGHGTFTQTALKEYPGGQRTSTGDPTSLRAGDFNGDGQTDLALIAIGNTPHVLLNDDGTFDWGTSPDPGFYFSSCPNTGGNPSVSQLVVSDVDGDGRDDLTINWRNSQRSCGHLTTILAKADGTWGTPVEEPFAIGSLGPADLDGDGASDLLLATQTEDPAPSGLRAALGNGDGTHLDPIGLPNGSSASYGVAVSDLDGDGITDLISAGDDGRAEILRGIDGRSFRPAVIDPTPGTCGGTAPGDFNGDGLVDLARDCDGHLVTLVNEGWGQAPPDDPGDPDPPPPTTGGFDFEAPSHPLKTTPRGLARGLDIAGSCKPACQVHGEISVSPKVAKKLGLGDPLLVSNDAIWEGGGSLGLRTGAAGRQALKAYRGRAFKARLSLHGEAIDEATGKIVQSEPVDVLVRVAAGADGAR